MVACGLGHSDEHLLTGDLALRQSIIGGHEGASIVEAVGSQVTTVVPGDRVVLTTPSCGRCASCATGHPQLCDLGQYPATGAQTSDLTFATTRAARISDSCGLGAF